jgi:VWFA-related protein
MRKLLFASVLLLALPAVAQTSGPGFAGTVEVNVVNLDVAVTDSHGNRVTGLKKEDFDVFEDGKRVEIVNFDAQNGGAGALVGDGASRDPEEVWTLAIFFDDANIQPAHRARVIQQLHDFLARKTAPGDRILLATNDLGLHVRVPFTSDLPALDRGLQEISGLTARGEEGERERAHAVDAILDRLRGGQGLSSDPVPCPLEIAEPARTYAGARRQEVLRSLGALKMLVNSLSGMPGRKAVLHVSDGIPLTPGEEVFQFLAELCKEGTAIDLEGGESPLRRSTFRKPVYNEPAPPGNGSSVINNSLEHLATYQGESQAPLDAQTFSVAKELEALAAHANANRVTLYALQASGTQGIAAQAGSGPGDKLFHFASVGSVLRAGLRDSLQLLADETGGRAILDANDFGPGLSRMREDFSTLYSLGISPPHGGDGREHKLAVKVKRPGLQLRYRQSYRDKPALERTADRTLAALYYGVEDNPLDVEVTVGEQSPAEAGQYSVPLRLRIPLFKLTILPQNDVYQGSLRLMVVVRDEQGGMSALRQVEVPLRISRKEVLNAMGQYYVYNLTLNLKPGLQHVALAVRDDLGATASYLSRTVTAGNVASAAGPPSGH